MIPITNKEYNLLAKYIYSNYGIHLKKEKKLLLTGRLQSVLEDKGLENFTQYYEYLINDKTGKAAVTLIDKITTNHTFFMREVNHFYYFRDYVLPLLTKNLNVKDLRIWSAGCSSGEEPYTLAMIIDEFFGDKKNGWDTKILATDISNQVLEKAIKGIYTNAQIANIPANWKLNYFEKKDKEYSAISSKIKNEIIYRRFNLMEETFPFKKKFHVIFCRNVMIYFDNNTRDKLIDKFYASLENGGYLFIGHSESINRDNSKFKYVMPSVYKK